MIDDRIDTWVFDFADLVARKVRTGSEWLLLDEVAVHEIELIVKEAVLAALHEKTER